MLVILPSYVALMSIGAEGCRLGDGGRVGLATCLACHDGRSAPDRTSFLQTAHAGFFTCEDCHGPGLLHVRAGGRGGAFIARFSRLATTAEYAFCGECHVWEWEDYQLSRHAVGNAANCGDCHDIHATGRMTAPVETNALCLRCHWRSPIPGRQEEDVDFHTGPIHPVDPAGSGASRCVDCHMPPLGTSSGAPRIHTQFTVPPRLSVEAVENGVTPVPPNSCAGVPGCHDPDVPGSGFPHEPDDAVLNSAMQILYEVIGQRP